MTAPPTIACSNCGRVLGQEHRQDPRPPCPGCGGVTTILHRTASAVVNISPHTGWLHRRGQAELGFAESGRSDGTVAHSRLDGDKLQVNASGPGTHGEDDSLPTCQRLVRFLNASGANWSEPIRKENVEQGINVVDDVDCVAHSTNELPSTLLQMQVVRAPIDGQYWRQLSLEGAASMEMDVIKASDFLMKSVQKKAAIPPEQRAKLLLVLDANRAPGIAFQAVVLDFEHRHGKTAASLGFGAIYVVGPDDALVKQLV